MLNIGLRVSLTPAWENRQGLICVNRSFSDEQPGL